MVSIIDGLLICVLLVITYQDMQFRSIHSFTLFMVLGLSIWRTCCLNDISMVLYEPVYILSFLAVQYLLVQLYFRIRKKTWIKLDEQIGWGDVLLLLAIVPLFSWQGYTLFYVVSLFVALVMHGSVYLLKRPSNKQIPLAAYISIVLILLLGANYFVEVPLML